MPEFSRQVLEVLREPLENGSITISRAARQVDFPARFQLLAAMNPCPCGYLGDADGQCRCTPDQILRYRARVSGPLLDRIDLRLRVPRVEPQQLLAAGGAHEESSATVRARVATARARQLQRQNKLNAALGSAELQQHVVCDDSGRQLLAQALQRFGLSARGYHRVLRVARTIADLAASEAVSAAHIAEALHYRGSIEH